jgi:hypothetical protein
MKTYVGVDVQIHIFLTLALVGGEWSASRPPGKSPRYPFYRRLGGPQSWSGQYGEVKIFYPTGTRTPTPPCSPDRSQSLYRLSYPGWKYGYYYYYYYYYYEIKIIQSPAYNINEPFNIQLSKPYVLL